MAGCEVCGSEIDMPFICPYCKGAFCADHRLPEAHGCPMFYVVRMQRPTYSSTSLPPSQSKPRTQGITSRVEVTHLIIAWLVLSLCFSIGYVFEPSMLLLMFIMCLGVVGTGFVFHELMHKFSAQRYGYWSEFRLWPRGLAMALLSSLITLGSFIFAAPGATYMAPRYRTPDWSDASRKKQLGLISLAGPLSNIVWAAIFFAMSGLDGLLGFIGIIGFQANLWLAAFNMIPLGSLDGKKVLSWSVIVWAMVAIPLWVIEAFIMLV